MTEVENSSPIVGAGDGPSSDVVGSPGPSRGRKRRQVSTPKHSNGRSGLCRYCCVKFVIFLRTEYPIGRKSLLEFKYSLFR